MLTVLDTNVVVSALLFRGRASLIHKAIIEGRLVPLVTPPILEEYIRVLSYPKFGLTKSDIHYLAQKEIGRWFHRLTEEIPTGSWIPEDPSDDMFINAARVRPGTCLVTGDAHILGARDRLPVQVLSVAEVLGKV